MAEQTIPVGGFTSLMGGMHAGIAPSILGETAYSRGINVSSRDGLVKTRPGFVPEVTLPAGAFQGMLSWSLNSGTRIVIAIGGKLCVYAVDTGALQTFDTELDAQLPFYFCQAERFLVVQDTVHPAVVLQEKLGSVEIRLEPHQIPIGAAMAFSNGRIHLTPNEVEGENGRPYLVSLDIFDAANPANCLNSGETMYLSEGGAHGVPMESGYIQAFAPLRNSASGTGYGNLIVFSRRGVSAFDMSVPRDQWKTEPLSQVLYLGPGTISPWGVTPVNGTLLYRGVDGLRILSYAVSAAQSTGDVLSMVPQSAEVAPFMGREDRAYLPRVSVAVSDNRAFVTVGGVDGVWFKALVVADFARISSMQSAATEVAYDGIWQVEGRRFGGVCGTVKDDEEVLYAYMDDGRLWRLDPTATLDDTTPIRSRLTTRTLLLDSPDLKRLSQVQVWLEGLTRDTQLTVYSRPMGYPLWELRGTLALKVAAGSLPQRRRAISMSVPRTEGASDPVSGEYLNLGTGHQFVLEWTGPAVIEMFRAVADLVQEPPPAPCDEQEGEPITVAHGVDLGEYL
jgi:hypothetical protein